MRAAFPASLSSGVDEALRVLNSAEWRLHESELGTVSVDGETLRTLMRLYCPEPPPDVFARMPALGRAVLACLLTRHHDGYVRERSLRWLFPSSESWVLPFLLSLVGEYVVEIIQVELQHIDSFRNQQLARFAHANTEYIRRLRHRLINYWWIYYRPAYPKFRDYPGYVLMSGLGLWDRRAAPRLLRS